MGEVYNARGTLLDRFVALKVIRDELPNGIDIQASVRSYRA
jgi:hypothetical protein